jgi:hypothetical protein
VEPLSFEVVATPDLVPGHKLSVTDVGFDDVAVRIEYQIVPPLPRGILGFSWFGTARDDLGNRYDDVGGAFGPSADGERTEGTLSLPLPVPHASVLYVRLLPRDDPAASRSGSRAYELRVSLVL